MRKSWGTLLKGDGVLWGRERGSGLTDRKRLRREAEKPRARGGTLPGPYPPLTLRISPRLKLSSSSAVALKSYLAMASMLGLPRTAVRAVGRKRSPKPPLLPRRLPAQPSRGPAPSETPAPSLTYREAGGRSALGEGEEEEETGH